MPIFLDIPVFQTHLPESGPLIGLDVGAKTIGIALSDTRRTIASSRLLLKRTKFTVDATYLLTFATKEEATGFVIGWPLNMDGSEGPMAQSIRAFARNLSEKTPLPITLWDERLSTRAVERMLLENDTSRKRRQDLKDKLAAAWILQGLLDSLSR